MTYLEIQQVLADLNYPVGIVDGLPGPRTEAAVRQFQQEHGLVVDGDPGPQTQIALRRAAPEPDKGAILQPVPTTLEGSLVGHAPPNVSSLRLLETKRPINELIWHCTATPAGRDFTVDDIRQWHRARGWTDIGYHYVVYRDGRILPGRPIGQIGAHVEGHNTGTVGCSYIGGLSSDGKRAEDTRTPEQRASMLWLTEQLVAKHGITKVSGHNQYANKACPSFDVRKDPLGALAK